MPQTNDPYFVQFPDFGLIINFSQIQMIEYDEEKREAMIYFGMGQKKVLTGDKFELLCHAITDAPFGTGYETKRDTEEDHPL